MCTMHRRIVWIAVAVPLASITVAAGAAAALPAVRHLASALWNVPDRLPALAENSAVHYQPGAEDFARRVSALLPAAIARIEAAHGRPFAHPVTVGVYATLESFAAANGTGSPQPVGVAPFGRVILSPKLDWPQRGRLPAILTHEMSHGHIQGWISPYAYVRLPNWFKEGLAVMVSGGGGAELVSEGEARAAIDRGEHIDIEEAGSLMNVSEIRFGRAPREGTSSQRTVLAYRQAGMFVAYLRNADPPGFSRMMNAILDGRPFAQAVRAGYGRDVQSLWQQFAPTAGETARPG
jgi:hypothetical protein